MIKKIVYLLQRQEAIDAISNAKASAIDEVFLIFVRNDFDGKAKLNAIADEAYEC